MSAPPLLTVDAIDVCYGASQILFGVEFTVERGQTMALLGRNGAGKSTTFKAIIGILAPRAGDIRLDGESIGGEPPYRIARAGIGYVPEDRQVFPLHTVEDNLVIGARKGPGGTSWTLERVYSAFPILASLRNRLAGRLSGGEQQLLTIARTLMGNPELVLLDEPSEGLAPIVVQSIGDLLVELREAGVTVLMAEQNMRFCLRVATHATIIDKGEVVFGSTIEELRKNDEITHRYLAV